MFIILFTNAHAKHLHDEIPESEVKVNAVNFRCRSAGQTKLN